MDEQGSKEKQEESARPDWSALRELAVAQAGHFTTAQAASRGFSDQLLSGHVAGGRLDRAMRGIYRVADLPAFEDEDLMVALLWAGPEAAISHESALRLHGLSDALPGRIHLRADVGRRAVPDHLLVTAGPAQDVTWLGPVRVTRPARSVLDVAQAGGDPDIVAQAIEEGVRRGLFTVRDVAPAVAWLHERGTW